METQEREMDQAWASAARRLRAAFDAAEVFWGEEGAASRKSEEKNKERNGRMEASIGGRREGKQER